MTPSPATTRRSSPTSSPPSPWTERHGGVLGLDLSPGMIAVAREREPELAFGEGSMLALPIKDGAWAGEEMQLRTLNDGSEFGVIKRYFTGGGLTGELGGGSGLQEGRWFVVIESPAQNLPVAQLIRYDAPTEPPPGQIRDLAMIGFTAMFTSVWLLWLTVRLYRSGGLKRRDESEIEEALLRSEEGSEADR